MQSIFKRAACLVLIALFAFPANAELKVWVDGQNMASAFMRVFSESLPPIGYVRFCERYPKECQITTSSNRRITLTPKRWKELVTINGLVNQSIQPISDKDLYGRIEHWTYPQSKGDCEDYVLLKRRLLMKKGWPAGSLLITVVTDENGEGHAILTARTSSGDFLLDNKRQDVLPWNQLPYKFVKRQSYRNPQVWMSLIPTKDQDPVTSVGKKYSDRVLGH